jgi:hypothetical protein
MLRNTSLILTLALSLFPYARAVAVPAPETEILGACALSSGGLAGCKLDGSGLIYGCDEGYVSSLENTICNYLG